ncbi:unnamed protein product [Allacma fusca]|uniref:Uncharacterized protein n=1 Tax=Allacma fusca TaxID=39272 RepID=A0A8J2PVP5_9HEXA|nr:unnamed protein product [Allacma fusca]
MKDGPSGRESVLDHVHHTHFLHLQEMYIVRSKLYLLHNTVEVPLERFNRGNLCPMLRMPMVVHFLIPAKGFHKHPDFKCSY